MAYCMNSWLGSEFEDVDVVANPFSLVLEVVDGSSTAGLQFDEQELLEIVEHLLLLHAGHVSLCHSLSLSGELQDFLVALLHLQLYVLLIALAAAAPAPVALQVVGLLSQSDHLQIDELVLELVYLQLGVHAFDLASQLAHFLLYFLDIFFDLAGCAEEADLLGLVFVLNLLKLAQYILLLF
jgi:hypothetical protein